MTMRRTTATEGISIDVDILDIATYVSEKINEVFPSYYRAVHFSHDDDNDNVVNTIEVANTIGRDRQNNLPDAPVGNNIDEFWSCCYEGNGMKNKYLSEEMKRYYFWQYHRSMGCHEYTLILANCLKKL